MIEHIAVHELGHTLGFSHEHTRPDRPAGTYCDNFPGTDPANVVLTPFDKSSIMNYCSDISSRGDGHLSYLDVLGVQSLYGANTAADADKDGIPDRTDNCPYASNRDQRDSNFEAEYMVGQRAVPAQPTNDGHLPIASDPQTYVDHWHEAFRGDACDTNPVVEAMLDITPTTSAGTCGTSASTVAQAGVTFTGYRSSANGARLPKNGATTHPALCRCDFAGTGLGDVLACQSDPLFQCVVGDDAAFPGVGATTRYLAMSQCGSVAPIAPVTALSSPAAGWANTPSSAPTIKWNSSADTVQFSLAPGMLNAILWTHAEQHTTSTASAAGPAFAPNLPNHYTTASSRYWSMPFIPAELCVGCQFPWWTTSLLDVRDLPPILVFGSDVTGARVPLFQKEEKLVPATSTLTDAAVGALALANTDVLPSLENSTGAIRGRASVTAILVNRNTGFIRGAFSLNPDRRTTYVSAVGHMDEVSTTNARAFVASEGASGTLFSLRGSNLVKQDVAAALASAPTRDVKPITGTPLGAVKSMAWDLHTRSLYVLDVLGVSFARLRLLRVSETGASTVLWESPLSPRASLPANVYVQTNAQGQVLVSLSFASRSEWGLFSTSGTALNSGSWNEPLKSAPFISDAFIAAPFARATGAAPELGRLRIEKTSRARMAYGSCATVWLKNFVPTVPCGDGWNGVEPTTDDNFECTVP